jgi:hypothetical protein
MGWLADRGRDTGLARCWRPHSGGEHGLRPGADRWRCGWCGRRPLRPPNRSVAFGRMLIPRQGDFPRDRCQRTAARHQSGIQLGRLDRSRRGLGGRRGACRLGRPSARRWWRSWRRTRRPDRDRCGRSSALSCGRGSTGCSSPASGMEHLPGIGADLERAPGSGRRSGRLPRRSARLSGGAEHGGRGVAPVFVGTWGAVDLIRDPFADATSGGLRLTALATVDATAAAQLRVLTAARPWRSTLCDSFRPMTPEGARGRLQRRRRRWFRQRTPGSRRATWGRYGRPDLGTARGRARGNLSAMWPCQSVSGKP